MSNSASGENTFSEGSRLFSRQDYILGKIFWMPHQTGLKRAIATEKSREIMLSSLYTMLITGTFMGFWILISMLLPRIIAKVTPRLPKDKAFRMACAWEVTEPFQAVFIMGCFCWQKLLEIWTRLRNPEGVVYYTHAMPELRKDGLDGLLNTKYPSNSAEKPSTNKELVFDFCSGILVLVLALGVVVGGVLAGIYLPDGLIIGHVAPVNASQVFLPNYLLQPSEVGLQAHIVRAELMDNERVVRTGAAVAAEALALERRVHVMRQNITELETVQLQKEKPYDIHYNYTVTGVDMGLQSMSGLKLNVTGKCEFQYSWYAGTVIASNTMYDRYTLWGNDTAWASRHDVDLNSTCSSSDVYYDSRLQRDDLPFNRFDGAYLLNPFAQGMSSLFGSADPWYFTGPSSSNITGKPWECSFFERKQMIYKYRVQPGRPMLRCQEQMYLSYQGTSAALSLLPIRPPDGQLNLSIYERWASEELPKILPRDTKVPRAVTLIMWMNIALYAPLPSQLVSASLKYATRNSPPFDGENASAFADVKRLVYTSYLATRNMYRDTALAYKSPKLPEAIHNYTLDLNLLVNSTTGHAIDGAGDFVIPSDQITTLRLEAVVAIPGVLVLTWLVIFLVWFFYRDTHNRETCQVCGQ